LKQIPSAAVPSSSSVTANEAGAGGDGQGQGEDDIRSSFTGSTPSSAITYTFNGSSTVLPTSVMRLFSGSLLCKNFIPSSSNLSTIPPMDLNSFWLPSKATVINSVGGSCYSRFYGLKISKEDRVASLVPFSPLVGAVVDVAWDYDHQFCAALSTHGVINILHYSVHGQSQTLQAFASIDTFSLSGTDFIRWYCGTLLSENQHGTRTHYLVCDDEEKDQNIVEQKKWRVHSVDGVLRLQ
jgi:hypothetical protein